MAKLNNDGMDFSNMPSPNERLLKRTKKPTNNPDNVAYEVSDNQGVNLNKTAPVSSQGEFRRTYDTVPQEHRNEPVRPPREPQMGNDRQAERQVYGNQYGYNNQGYNNQQQPIQNNNRQPVSQNNNERQPGQQMNGNQYGYNNRNQNNPNNQQRMPQNNNQQQDNGYKASNNTNSYTPPRNYGTTGQQPVNTQVASDPASHTEPQSTQQMPPKEPQKSPEQLEIERIMSLPFRSVKSGQKEYSGYYDEANLILYLADAEGKLTKQKAKLQRALGPETSDTSTSYQGPPKRIENNAGMSVPSYDEDEELDSKKDKKKAKLPQVPKLPKFSKKQLIIFGIIALVVIFMLAIVSMKPSIPSNPNNPSGTTVTNNQTVSVMLIKQDIIPGTVLTEDLVQQENISTELYNQIASNGRDLCLWERRADTIGMYITTYIKKGQYMYSDALSALYDTPLNPWYGIWGVATTMQINDTVDQGKLVPGVLVDITFKIEESIPQNAPADPTAAGGIQQETVQYITTTKSYVFNDIIVSDVLAQGSSLFDLYAALHAVPETDRSYYLSQQLEADEKFTNTVTADSMILQLTEEQKEALTKAIKKNQPITVTVKDIGNTDTTTKSGYFKSFKATHETIRRLLSAKEKEAKK